MRQLIRSHASASSAHPAGSVLTRPQRRGYRSSQTRSMQRPAAVAGRRLGPDRDSTIHAAEPDGPAVNVNHPRARPGAGCRSTIAGHRTHERWQRLRARGRGGRARAAGEEHAEEHEGTRPGNSKAHCATLPRHQTRALGPACSRAVTPCNRSEPRPEPRIPQSNAGAMHPSARRRPVLARLSLRQDPSWTVCGNPHRHPPALAVPIAAVSPRRHQPGATTTLFCGGGPLPPAPSGRGPADGGGTPRRPTPARFPANRRTWRRLPGLPAFQSVAGYRRTDHRPQSLRPLERW